MEDKLTEFIDNNKDELIVLIKKHTEDTLFLFDSDYSLKTGYDVRNEVVMYTYGVIMKKYINKNAFKSDRDKIIKNIVQTYIITKNL